MKGEQQYLDTGKRLLEEGVWVLNERTGKRCLTITNATHTYNVGDKEFPILTTKQVFWKSAIAEMVGYLRGYTSSEEFRKIGCKTWEANANKTQAWLDNPARKGKDDLGKIYGAVAKDFGGIDLIRKVYDNLRQGIDDRGEIITFWKPDDFDKGCLRPCMFQHHFTLLEGTLHLTSYQRSCDYALGVPFNMIQCYFLLELMSTITGHKAGIATHHMVNLHLYEDQVDLFKMQIRRIPLEVNPCFYLCTYFAPYFEQPKFNLEWMEDEYTPSHSSLMGYKHSGRIDYPFSE